MNETTFEMNELFGDMGAQPPRPRILIVGHGRHGKDTVAEILQVHFGLTYKSSSEHCAEKLIFPALKDKYNYVTTDQCFADRHNHRAEWYDLISDYCKDDPARLGNEIFKVSDIYCGLRNKREFHGLKNTGGFDVSLWVDRSNHLPPEDAGSMTIEPWMCDFVIDNNNTLDELTLSTVRLMRYLKGEDVHVTQMGIQK